MTRSDFRIVLINRSPEDSTPAMPHGSYIIVYVGEGQYRHLGFDKQGFFRFVETEGQSIWFKSPAEAGRRLDHALEYREFDRELS